MNTGPEMGHFVLLQKKMGKPLLPLACRKHAPCELILKKAWFALFGETTNPAVPMFGKLKSEWDKLPTGCENNARMARLPLEDMSFIEWEMVVDIGTFLKKLLASPTFLKAYGRADYKEFIDLTLFMTHSSQSITMNRPAADHHARFMSKQIYADKLVALNPLREKKNQLSEKVVKKLVRYSKFTCLVFAKYYLQVSLIKDAAFNDREFYNSLMVYKSIDPLLGFVALQTLRDHSWYLSEPNIGIALFSDKVTNEEKSKMATKIKELDFSVPIPLEKPYLPRLLDSSFDQHVGIKTRTLFENFDIDLEFLDKDPSEWTSDDKFNSAKEYVENISCVNDFSERNIKLMSDYNKVWTKDEDEKQNYRLLKMYVAK